MLSREVMLAVSVLGYIMFGAGSAAALAGSSTPAAEDSSAPGGPVSGALSAMVRFGSWLTNIRRSPILPELTRMLSIEVRRHTGWPACAGWVRRAESGTAVHLSQS